MGRGRPGDDRTLDRTGFRAYLAPGSLCESFTFPSGNRIGTYDEVIEVRNSLRLQRRMRRRGLRPDAHLPRGYRL